VLEAGSAAGARDIAVVELLGTVTALLATDVPPGRYFVRVRATNFNGSSVSDDLIVDVP
jgi:hypothetical protein